MPFSIVERLYSSIGEATLIEYEIYLMSSDCSKIVRRSPIRLRRWWASWTCPKTPYSDWDKKPTIPKAYRAYRQCRKSFLEPPCAYWDAKQMNSRMCRFFLMIISLRAQQIAISTALWTLRFQPAFILRLNFSFGLKMICSFGFDSGLFFSSWIKGQRNCCLGWVVSWRVSFCWLLLIRRLSCCRSGCSFFLCTARS